jgi:hypothetical protein
MKTAIFLSAAALLLAPPRNAAAQNASPTVTVEYTNPGLSPAHWTMTLHPDGSGHFTSLAADAPTDHSGELGLPAIDRDITVSKQFAASLFQTAARQAWFTKDCESHLKVAFQGWKKLSYKGPEGTGSCTFNYSKDKELQELGDALLGVSTTVFEGAKLELLLEHDPLGLHKEMAFLVSAAEEGRARELCAIRGILARLAEDDHVMDMVRKQARQLLARADG